MGSHDSITLEHGQLWKLFVRKPLSLRQVPCQRRQLLNGWPEQWFLEAYIEGCVGCRRKTPSQKLPLAKEVFREKWYYSNWLFMAWIRSARCELYINYPCRIEYLVVEMFEAYRPCILSANRKGLVFGKQKLWLATLLRCDFEKWKDGKRAWIC